MFVYNKDNTITIKCDDGEFRTYSLDEKEMANYMRTGIFDYLNHKQIEGE